MQRKSRNVIVCAKIWNQFGKHLCKSKIVIKQGSEAIDTFKDNFKTKPSKQLRKQAKMY